MKTEIIRGGVKTAVEYAYDGDGLRTEKTVRRSDKGNAAEVTSYLYDRQHVILETRGNDDIRYVRGINYIARIEDTDKLSYFMYNGHGDVVQTVSEDGEIENQYDYDIFGNPTLTVENYQNSIRYAGEFYDAETGLYYLRARYYDPYIGRFISEDSYWGEDTNPLSLNLYTYCSNNPIQYIDPTGHWQESDNSLPTEAKARIIKYTDDYNKAKAAGNKKGMDDAHAAAEALREANKKNSSSGSSGGSSKGGSSRGGSSSRGSRDEDAAKRQAEETRRKAEAQIAEMLKGNENAKDLMNLIKAEKLSYDEAMQAGKQEEADLYKQMAEVLLEKMKKQIEEEKKQATVNVNKDLKLGARGSEVVILQQMLHNQGYSNIKPDGIFGPQTEKAVKDLQRSFKLKDDGIVGDKTKALLNGLAVESSNSRNEQLILPMSTNVKGTGNDNKLGDKLNSFASDFIEGNKDVEKLKSDKGDDAGTWEKYKYDKEVEKATRDGKVDKQERQNIEKSLEKMTAAKVLGVNAPGIKMKDLQDAFGVTSTDQLISVTKDHIRFNDGSGSADIWKRVGKDVGIAEIENRRHPSIHNQEVLSDAKHNRGLDLTSEQVAFAALEDIHGVRDYLAPSKKASAGQNESRESLRNEVYEILTGKESRYHKNIAGQWTDINRPDSRNNFTEFLSGYIVSDADMLLNRYSTTNVDLFRMTDAVMKSAAAIMSVQYILSEIAPVADYYSTKFSVWKQGLESNSVSTTGDNIFGANTVGAAERKMFGSNGVQVTSKTVWKGQYGLRLDVENPNPGQRPGQIHLQDANGNKYLFDPDSSTFKGAPNWINNMLKNDDFVKGLNKGLEKYLGEWGI